MEHMYLVHSAKGSTWKDHKYLKVVDGKYYYADDVKGGKDTEVSREELIKKLQNGEFGTTKEELAKFYKMYPDLKDADKTTIQNPKLDPKLAEENETAKTKKNKKDDITAETTDADIIKNALGKDYDSVREKVIAKQNETGRTDLNDDEIKEILGDKYDSVQKSILDQADKRSKAKEKSESSDSSKEKSSSSKSSGESSGSSKSSGGSGGSSKSSGGSGSSSKSSGGSSGSSKSSGGSSGSSDEKKNPSTNAKKPSTDLKKPEIDKKKTEKQKPKITEKEAMKYIEKFYKKYPDFQSNKKTAGKVSREELKKYYDMLAALRGK